MGHAILRVVSDEDDDFLHAADEPTAMWDEGSLRDLGLDIPIEQKETAPATTGTGAHRAIGIELTGPDSATKSKGATMLHWIVTITLAVGLGVGVFFLVRMFR